MKEHFQERLDELRRHLILMAGEVEKQIRKSLEAWQENSVEKAREVIAFDTEIDQMEIHIEEEAIRLLALEQPVAVDLRFLVGVLKINDDLERMGDHAENIAECVLRLSTEKPGLQGFRAPSEMAEEALGMLRDALEAFIRKDTVLAAAVIRRDDRLDDKVGSIIRELLTYMAEKPALISRCLELISIAKNLERVGDLATNICETTIFISQARLVRHHAAELE